MILLVRKNAIRLLAAVGFLGLTSFALAQTNAADVAAQSGASFDAEVKRLDQDKQGLERIATALRRAELDDRALADLRAQTAPIAADLQGVIAEIAPKLDALKTRLDQLGPKPDDKAPPESAAVTKERADQQKLFDDRQELIKRAKLLAVQTDQTAASVAARRRALFTTALFQSSASIASPSLWLDVAREAPENAASLAAVFAAAGANALGRLGAAGLSMLAALCAALAAAWALLAKVADRVIARDAAGQKPSEWQKARAALWTCLVVTALPVAAIWSLVAALRWFNLFDSNLAPLALAVSHGVIRVALAGGLASAILAPRRPLWRLIDAPEPLARRLTRLAILAAFIMAAGKILAACNEIYDASLSFSAASRGAVALLVALVLARGLYGLAGEDEDSEQRSVSAWQAPARFAIWAALVGVIGAALLGYVALAAFIVDQIAWDALVFGLLFLAVKLARSGVETAFRPGSTLSRSLMSSLGLRHESLQQLGALLDGGLYVALCGVAILLVLAPWGLQSDDLLGSARSAFFGLEIGGVTISLSSLVLALAFFALGYALTHGFQGWLENSYLPLTSLDTGLRASIGASVGYIGVLLSLGLAVGFIGINLEKLALIAGALSVGVGLGLQSVVNNFVSGLILLWERTIRVGDWVVVGEEQGLVRRINVRATEIETFDRATMIVPNANMVGGIVKNWVRGDRSARIKIPFFISSAVDPEQARALLIEAAKAHDLVVGIPAPTVMFTSFANGALNFELVCFVEDVETAGRVKSDLLFAVFKLFKDAGIESSASQAPAPVRLIDLQALLNGLKDAEETSDVARTRQS